MSDPELLEPLICGSAQTGCTADERRDKWRRRFRRAGQSFHALSCGLWGGKPHFLSQWRLSPVLGLTVLLLYGAKNLFSIAWYASLVSETGLGLEDIEICSCTFTLRKEDKQQVNDFVCLLVIILHVMKKKKSASERNPSSPYIHLVCPSLSVYHPNQFFNMILWRYSRVFVKDFLSEKILTKTF